MVEENGNHDSDPLDSKGISVTCVQSVIQPNQQSVIQSATGNIQPTVLTKGNVILVSKPNSVIQTPQGSLQTLQVVVEAHGSDDEDSLSPQNNIKKRRDILSHSPSRRKIENNLNTGEIFPKIESSGSDCDSNLDSELSSHSISVSSHYQSVLPNEPLHLPSQNEDVQGLSTITMTTTGSTTGGTILHYAGQDGQFFVPGEIVVMQNTNNDTTNTVLPEDQAKKREIRLLKNREAARECRRKKKSI